MNTKIRRTTNADDSDDLSMDTATILKTIEILYPDTYKKKVSALKTIRTKNFLKSSK